MSGWQWNISVVPACNTAQMYVHVCCGVGTRDFKI